MYTCRYQNIISKMPEWSTERWFLASVPSNRLDSLYAVPVVNRSKVALILLSVHCVYIHKRHIIPILPHHRSLP